MWEGEQATEVIARLPVSQGALMTTANLMVDSLGVPEDNFAFYINK